MTKRWVKRGVKFAVTTLVAIVVLGLLVKGLWNWLMPPLFGLHTLTFEQAWDLLALSWILFGGLRGVERPVQHWRRRFMERWDAMTPEEREKFQSRLREQGGPCGAPAEQKQ